MVEGNSSAFHRTVARGRAAPEVRRCGRYCVPAMALNRQRLDVAGAGAHPVVDHHNLGELAVSTTVPRAEQPSRAGPPQVSTVLADGHVGSITYRARSQKPLPHEATAGLAAKPQPGYSQLAVMVRDTRSGHRSSSSESICVLTGVDLTVAVCSTARIAVEAAACGLALSSALNTCSASERVVGGRARRASDRPQRPADRGCAGPSQYCGAVRCLFWFFSAASRRAAGRGRWPGGPGRCRVGVGGPAPGMVAAAAAGCRRTGGRLAHSCSAGAGLVGRGDGRGLLRRHVVVAY